MEKAYSMLMIVVSMVILVTILPEVGIFSVFLVSGIITLYYMAISGGLYKEPLLAQFRKYGDEQAFYPLCNALLAGGIWCLSMVGIMPMVVASRSYLARLLPGAVFTVLGLILIGASAAIYMQPTLRTALPPWYTSLIQNASRQERRHIGWAWLRLPLRMRMRLNGDNKAFAVWVELVRLTVIYGAYDPNSPWHRWT